MSSIRTIADEVREKVNIVDVISQYVKLEKRGKDYLGLCPFHSEKTPSFSVSEQKQFFYCYGCHKGGDAISFIREMDGVSFQEAVAKAAAVENISVNIQTMKPKREVPENIRELLEMHETATKLYTHALLNLAIGNTALDYLKNRGLSDETIQTFRIGYAVNERDFLVKAFTKLGKSRERMIESNLVAENTQGELYDRFSGRITFPICNENGDVVAFSARKLYSEEEARHNPEIKQNKYINSSDTPIFEKKLLLFNLNLAKKEMRKSKEVYLFEGQMDVIAAHQAGIINGVASLGTSLTDYQVKKIQQTAKTVVTVYDGDNAGVKATERAIEMFRVQKGLEMAIVSLPEGLDPDDYTQKYGAKALCKTLQEGRKSIYLFKKIVLRQKYNVDNETQLIQYVDELLEEMVQVVSKLEVDLYVNELVKEFPLFTKDALLEQLAQKQKQQEEVPPSIIDNQHEEFLPFSPEDTHEPIDFVENHSGTSHNSRNTTRQATVTLPTLQNQQKSSVEKAEEQLLYRLFYERKVQNEMKKVVDFRFAHESYENIYLLLCRFLEVKGDFTPLAFLSFVEDENLKSKISGILTLDLSVESENGEIADLIKRIKKQSIEKRLLEVKEKLTQAQKSGNRELARECLKFLMELKREAAL